MNATSKSITGPSGFIGYGDLWGFIWHDSFIINPGSDLSGFLGITWWNCNIPSAISLEINLI